MRCAKCGENSKVISVAKDEIRVYRYRECLGCQRRWHTEEYENNSPRVALAVNRIRDKKYKKGE